MTPNVHAFVMDQKQTCRNLPHTVEADSIPSLDVLIVDLEALDLHYGPYEGF